MRETPELPALTASKRRIPILLGLALPLAVWLATSGCGIKRTVKIEVPPGILNAKTATFDELLNILRNYDDISDLKSTSLRVSAILGKMERGELDKYRNAPGYILLRRPDSTHLVIQNPVTKTAELDLLSMGDDLRVWIPSQNKFYMGKNSAKELVAEDLSGSTGITIRATHVFEAILPTSIRLDSPGIQVSMHEENDASTSYYVLFVYKEGGPSRIYPVRRIWIERSGLTIARHQVFEDGRIAGDIVYSNMTQTDSFFLPLKIHIDRPLDGYALNMEFKSWQVNSDLKDNVFVLTPPSGAQIIHLKEKTRSDTS